MGGVVFLEPSLVLCAVFLCVYCHDNGTYTGLLTPGCVSGYNRMYLTRMAPPRTYQYYHETLDILHEDKPGEDSMQYKFRIVGGNKISITKAPYSVLYGLYCGGSLIAPDWVLTAAHCKDKETFVLAGSTKRSEASHYTICAHFIHPLWSSATKQHPHDFDYQLVLLETPVPITPNSRPIAIGNTDDIKPGERVFVTGWGHIKQKERMHDILRGVSVPIFEHEVCNTLPLKNYHHISVRMFCAGLMKGTKDSCQGDSGGPAVIRGKLVGLVSFGVGCAQRDQPGVYSNVPAAREWIRFITALPL